VRIGVPMTCSLSPILNTDAREFGGSGVELTPCRTQKVAANDYEHSVVVASPAMSVSYYCMNKPGLSSGYYCQLTGLDLDQKSDLFQFGCRGGFSCYKYCPKYREK